MVKKKKNPLSWQASFYSVSLSSTCWEFTCETMNFLNSIANLFYWVYSPDYSGCHIWQFSFLLLGRIFHFVCVHMLSYWWTPVSTLLWRWAMNVGVHMPLRQQFASFRSIFRCGSCGSLISNYVRTCLFSIISVLIYLPTNGVPDFPFLSLQHKFLTFLITSILKVSGDNSVINNSDHLSNT